jgi:hypothetical protein
VKGPHGERRGRRWRPVQRRASRFASRPTTTCRSDRTRRRRSSWRPTSPTPRPTRR